MDAISATEKAAKHCLVDAAPLVGISKSGGNVGRMSGARVVLEGGDDTVGDGGMTVGSAVVKGRITIMLVMSGQQAL